jgi:hypothetical protein
MSAKRKNSLHQQVRRAYSQDALTHVLTLPEAEFGREFNMQTTEVEQRGWTSGWKKGDPIDDAPNDYYHFRDNGSHVLAVAHLDTVVRPQGRVPVFHNTASGPAVVSGALDDRLGAYVILRLLPELGVNCDWLLTVGEEDGQSTASFFDPGKTYDHVIEFDRAGTDVVMYQYEDRDSRAAVQASGAKMGHGSFSDICYLEQLGVKAFNWGVGYDGNYHSEKGYAILCNTFAMVAKYLRFHTQNAGIAMPHEFAPVVERSFGGGLYDSGAGASAARYYHGDTRDYGEDCDLCGAYLSVDPETLVCSICRSCSECGRDELSHRAGCLAVRTRDDDAAYEEWVAEHYGKAEPAAKPLAIAAPGLVTPLAIAAPGETFAQRYPGVVALTKAPVITTPGGITSDEITSAS